MEDSSFHALVICPKALELWDLMRQDWPLLAKEKLVDTGKEWLFGILADHSEEVRAMITILLWRIWSLCNDMLHDKMVPPPEISRSFLLSYLSSYSQAHRYGIEDILKGKMPVVDTPRCLVLIQKEIKPWPKPPLGWVALSVDGAFVKETGRAGSGMIPRDSEGAVIFFAYRYLYHCKDAPESEISVVLEGVSFSVQHSELPIVIQSDSSIVVVALTDDSLQ
ncbi:protein transport protein sec24 [Hordeum vulgare]|nr:protein transport protein sec24 [Hordeum vulgare]